MTGMLQTEILLRSTNRKACTLITYSQKMNRLSGLTAQDSKTYGTKAWSLKPGNQFPKTRHWFLSETILVFRILVLKIGFQWVFRNNSVRDLPRRRRKQAEMQEQLKRVAFVWLSKMVPKIDSKTVTTEIVVGRAMRARKSLCD